jgi:glycogen operon protein
MLMQHTHPALQFSYPLTYGAIVHEGGVQFRVFSHSATEMRLLVYDDVADLEPSEIIPFDRETDRWGDIWSAFVPGIDAGQLYHFQADGPFDPERGHRFDPKARLIDPYARALAGDYLPGDDGIVRPPKCVVVDDYFDWAGDRHIRRPLAESVIYEMHVRGFTQHASSGVSHPGTYLGVIEKIPYLKALGVTAIELMPVHEFPTNTPDGRLDARPNYWGYDPMAFFAPHRGYSSQTAPGCQVNEFKQMVRALHKAGIEVILDVVFNHTCEGNELGPTIGFKGLENRVYYMLANGGSRYRNYSGCGNTINGNHPIVREMIFHCLRHWVHNYHVDGFRFDLASILSRDRNGNLVPNPPMVEVIAEDPMLADTKIIAEAWDAAGAYQVGTFATLRWAEWNGRFRDDLRRFWRSDADTRPAVATRLAGSSDLYEQGGRKPYHSINFITSHDGFTLADLATYADKHNEANGEGNRDGENLNYSANFGVEGPTTRPGVLAARARQMRNFLASLFLSQGVPMLLAGDECRRTQQGNNNAYCQDNEVSWFDWKLVEENVDLVRFVQALIKFRRETETVRRTEFLSGEPRGARELPDVSWFDVLGQKVDWDENDHSLICLLGAPTADSGTAGMNPAARSAGRHVMLLLHAGSLPRRFKIPKAAAGLEWRLFIDTGADSPRDIYPLLDGPKPPAIGHVLLKDRSIKVYVASA